MSDVESIASESVATAYSDDQVYDYSSDQGNDGLIKWDSDRNASQTNNKSSQNNIYQNSAAPSAWDALTSNNRAKSIDPLSSSQTRNKKDSKTTTGSNKVTMKSSYESDGEDEYENEEFDAENDFDGYSDTFEQTHQSSHSHLLAAGKPHPSKINVDAIGVKLANTGK